MGVVDWRGWDRLDALDRRMGFRRPWTEASILRTQRLLWVATVLVFVGAMISLLERDWAWAATFFAIGVLSVLRDRRFILKLRERLDTEG